MIAMRAFHVGADSTAAATSLGVGMVLPPRPYAFGQDRGVLSVKLRHQPLSAQPFACDGRGPGPGEEVEDQLPRLTHELDEERGQREREPSRMQCRVWAELGLEVEKGRGPDPIWSCLH